MTDERTIWELRQICRDILDGGAKGHERDIMTCMTLLLKALKDVHTKTK